MQNRLKNKAQEYAPVMQGVLFDYIETVNTPSKEEKQTIPNGDDLSEFNKNLKKALDYNPTRVR